MNNTHRHYGSYSRTRKRSAKRMKRWHMLAALAVLTSVALGAFFLFGGDTTKLPAIIKREPAKPQKIRIEGRYLFNGTVVWARHMQEWSVNADGTPNYAYPFSGLNTFDRSKYDAWTADLECPSVQEDLPLAEQNSKVAFNCRPEFLPEAAKYFNFFNLANNHTYDMHGDPGLVETRANLEKNDIQYYGDFEPGKLDNICEVVALPVRIISTLEDKESSTTGNLPVAFCAWHYFFRLPLPGELEQMKQYAAVMPVFAFVQQGVEYRPKADDYQRLVAHKIAELGPHFVVVNSAHWVQDGEVYKGIPILYSTGNFIFDQQSDGEVTRSASLDGNMTIDYTPELDKWLALGDSCKTFHDTCLEQIKQQGLQQPKLSFAYDLVAGDDSNKLSKRAGDAVQKAVEERVGWAAIKAALGQ